MVPLGQHLDGITATLRGAAWHQIARRTEHPLERERLSGIITMNGTRHYPAIPQVLIADWLRGGILNERSRHQNNPDSPLGYLCLDGFAIPNHLVRQVILDGAEVREIQLFTDGYFAPGDVFGGTSWEDRFAAVEREDPAKMGPYASVKGSVGGLWSDDRTYIGIRRLPSWVVTEGQAS